MLTHEEAQELQAANAALDAALQRANSRIAHYCASCGRSRGIERDGTAYCVGCCLTATQADVDARTPDAGREWLADARAVTAVAALYRKEMQTLFDGLKMLPSHLADMIDPLVVSHLCTQLALWLGEPDSEEILAHAKARWGLEA